MSMTRARKRKFQRWFNKGIPKGAALHEKYAFGAYKTNRGKREEKRAGLVSKGRAKRIHTKNTAGYERQFSVDKPLSTLDDLQWRGKISRVAENFRKGKRGKVVFIRLLLALSPQITYATVELEESPDGMVKKWFGSREGHSDESTLSAMHELCDRILEGIGDSRDGLVEEVAIFTLTSRRK